MAKTNFRPFHLGLLMGLALLLAMCALPEGALAEGDGGAAGLEPVSEGAAEQLDDNQANELPSDDSSSQAVPSADNEPAALTEDAILAAQSGPGAPSKSNPHFYSTQNPFYPTYAPGGSGLGSNSLGNCTWYAFGRAFDYLGSRPNLCTGNADKWYDYNKNHNYYPYGNTPQVGAVACFSNQHVAVVEAVDSTGVWLSESGAPSRSHPNGFLYDYRKLGSWGSADATLQGYIYIVSAVHTHSWAVDHYEYYNDVNHTVVYRCSSCGETKVEREAHTFKWVGGDRIACTCTSCGTEETFTDDGGKGYVTKYKVDLHSGDNPGADVIATIPGGTLLHLSEVTLGSWGRYAGKVSYGGQTGYVMISDCYINNEAGVHTFVNGVCTECGIKQVGSTPGRYRFARGGTGYYGAPFSADARSFSAGDEVVVAKVARTSSGNLWGWLSDGCLVDMADLAYPAVDSNWQNGVQVSVGTGPFVIAPVANTGVCLDVENGSAASGTNVRLYEWNDTSSQQFTFAPSCDDDGSYVIKSALGDVVLDVYGGFHPEGTNVWTCTPNGTLAQKWYVERTPDGYYSLRSFANNLYLDYEGEASQFSNLRVMCGSKGASQKYLLIPTSCSVTFESNGGTTVSAVSARPRVAVQAPPTPTKTGYTFSGWYSDAKLTSPYDFSKPVLGDLTLYAGWSEVKDSITRLAGSGALDTMENIVEAGSFGAGGTVVLATGAGYWDALTASGVAGFAGAPVLLTSLGGESLSTQTSVVLARLRPATIVVCGGEAAVSAAVVDQARAAAGTSPRVVRCAGQSATGTACQIFSRASSELGYAWSGTAVVATNDGYWDALAAAPYAYARHAPIFLAEGHSSLSKETLDAMASGGITRVYIVGGERAVSKAVEGQLAERGIEVAGRLAGENAVMTSAAIAEFEVSQGMSVDGLGVATVDGYWDALTGAALCGSKGSVLVLASDSDRRAIDAVAAPSVTSAYVFGGKAAVSESTLGYLEGAIR